MAERYVVVDLETTGNSPKKGDRIIQFAAVVIQEGKITEEYSTFIHPEQPISVFIEELTGINGDLIKDAPVFEEAAGKIHSLIQGACFVAHNVAFDLSFLQEEFERCGYPPFYGSTLDTVELARILKPDSDGYKLNQLAKEENLDHDRPHRADSDAYVTALLLLTLKEKLYRLPMMTLKQLHKLSFSLKSEIHELIEECISLRLSKSERKNPLYTAYRGLAFRKTDTDKKASASPAPAASDYPGREELRNMLSAQPDFEERQGQLAMMDAVHSAFENGERSMIEAGTGIGKTLGYLLPAAYYAKKHGEPVTLSTYTLQLQDQLLQAEIPKLTAILPFPVRAVLLKGRGNYLSMAKFERAVKEKEDNYETALAKMQILVWLTETGTGDKDELHLTGGGELFWDRVKDDGHTDRALQEPWKKLDFFERAKAEAAKADLIVTNHAFLLADAASGTPVIPDGCLVLDEAHHIEKAASRHMGKRMDYLQIKTLMNRIKSADQRQLISRLSRLLEEHGFVPLPIAELDSRINDFLYEFDQLFHMLSAYAQKTGKHTGIGRVLLEEGAGSRNIRILSERLIGGLSDITASIVRHTDMLEGKELSKNALYYLNDLRMLVRRVQEVRGKLDEFFLHPDADTVYWVEFSKSVPHFGIALFSQPAAGGGKVYETFFSRRKSLVLTSATLAVNGSFRYLAVQLGMDPDGVKTYRFPSPFDYKQNVKILVAEDMPLVNTVSSEIYSAAAARHIISAVQAANGRTMVLFTSNDMLSHTYQRVKDTGFLQDYTLFAQGITGGSKARLLRNFQQFDKAVLFGTSGLWDGVDIPGEALSCLIIARLPFSPPEDPIQAVKARLLEEEGKKPFAEFALPEAILRFRQGFGRLIRTRNDRGVLVILDRRVTHAHYGKEFIKAIPEAGWKKVSAARLHEEIEEWLPEG